MSDKDIMKCVLDAAMHLNNDNHVEAKERLRDAIELINDHNQADILNTIKTEV